MSTISIILFFILGLFAGSWLYTWFKNKSAGRPVDLDTTIDAHANAMQKAENALSKSQEHLAHLQAKVSQSEADINILNARIQKAVNDGKDDEARNIIKRLKLEQAALDEHKANLEGGKKDHQWYADAVEKERKSMIDARQAAEGLNAKLALAEATKAYQASTTGLEDAKTELEAKVRVAESQVRATDASKKDEFLEAADNADVEATLAEFKKVKQ
jgi:hypothetical protein